MRVSVILRTYNEEKFLDELLQSISMQETGGLVVTTIIVDSGSTDRTLAIAKSHACNIVFIPKDEFTFGRSLNIGCGSSDGGILVFISGHCIPVSNTWLKELVRPLLDGYAEYAYGRQVGNAQSKYSEQQLFKKFYSDRSNIHQDGFFCNNANAALKKEVWEESKFDESLTGLEDMELAKRIQKAGGRIAYVASAPVYHIHDESWSQIRNRYEREAVALQYIMPEIQIQFGDFLRYWLNAVVLDYRAALKEKRLLKKSLEIIMFRYAQFWGSYKGNHEHRKLSQDTKERYFYPR